MADALDRASACESFTTDGLPALEILELTDKPDDKDIAFQFKVSLVGTSGVGKSSLLHCFKGRAFSPSLNVTIGVDFFSKYYRVKIMDTKSGGSDARTLNVTCNFWDTAGQENFGAMPAINYRGAIAVVVVFSLTDANSFGKVERYMCDAQTHSGHGNRTMCILIGNKLDLCPDMRQVSTEQWTGWASEKNILGFETSAKETTGVSEAFSETVKLAVLRGLVNQNAIARSGAPSSSSHATTLPPSRTIGGYGGAATPVFDPSRDATTPPPLSHGGTITLTDGGGGGGSKKASQASSSCGC